MTRSPPPPAPSSTAVPTVQPLDLSQGDAVDHLSLISLPTAASSAGVLLLIAAWFAGIFAVGLWGLRGAAAVPGGAASPLGLSTLAGGEVALGRLVLALALAASLTLLSVVMAMIVTWVRPLRSLVRATALLIQGQWHRPIPQSFAALAPVQQLAVIYEDLRRSLVDRLRSSTELNLQLESEVARRTAELERRNVELAGLLSRLESTRAELLRNQKLATVGRIASDVAGTIAEPMERLVRLSVEIGQAFDGLRDSAKRAHPPISTPNSATISLPIHAQLASLQDRLGLLIKSAAQASEVVRALRVYARPDPRPGPSPGPSHDPSPDRYADLSPDLPPISEKLPPAGGS